MAYELRVGQMIRFASARIFGRQHVRAIARICLLIGYPKPRLPVQAYDISGWLIYDGLS